MRAIVKKATTLVGDRQNGSDGWTRTSDRVVNSHLLYQLSYVGIINPLSSSAYILVVKEIFANGKSSFSKKIVFDK